jgi:hypothetical protein
MNVKDIVSADRLLREVNKEVAGGSMLDIKQRAFEEVKRKLYHITYLLSTEPVKQEHVLDRSDDLFAFFTKEYPEWELNTRKRTSVVPRQVLQYFLCMQPGWELEKVGMHTGCRDHTTVIHSRNLVRTMLGISEPVFVKVYNNVIDFLNTKNN